MDAKATSPSTGSAVSKKASAKPDEEITPSVGRLAFVPTNPAMVNVHAETAQRKMIHMRPRNWPRGKGRICRTVGRPPRRRAIHPRSPNSSLNWTMEADTEASGSSSSSHAGRRSPTCGPRAKWRSAMCWRNSRCDQALGCTRSASGASSSKRTSSSIGTPPCLAVTHGPP